MNLVSFVLLHPVFLVAVGGALGSVLRYGTNTLFQANIDAGQMPVATTLVNIVGSFLLGITAAYAKSRSQTLYLFLGVGFCGGLTTFSTLALELVEQLQRGRFGNALIECLLNLIFGMVALYVGYALLQNK